jgi:hypothetical protein
MQSGCKSVTSIEGITSSIAIVNAHRPENVQGSQLDRAGFFKTKAMLTPVGSAWQKEKVGRMVATMSPLARSKILKQAGTTVTAVESKLCEAYVELEAHSRDFQADMKSLQFYSAEEVMHGAALDEQAHRPPRLEYMDVWLLHDCRLRRLRAAELSSLPSPFLK